MNEELLNAFKTIDAALTGENKDEVGEVTTKLQGYAGEREIKLDDVKQYLAENDAGKEYYTNTASELKKNAVEEYLKSDDYKKSVEGLTKSAIEKREAELRKEYKLDPPSKEEQRIAELEAKQKEIDTKQAETDARLRLKEISLDAVSQLQEKKLPKDFLDFVVDPSSEEVTQSNIKKLADVFDAAVKQGVEAEFKKVGRDPQKGGRNTSQKITEKMLQDLATKAKSSGRVEDRVKYAEMKRLYAAQQTN